LVTNNKVKRYIRYGANQNSGASQTDVFIVDKDGNIDKDTPIIWDFDEISSITALPIENLLIKDSKTTSGYKGPAIFADFNPKKIQRKKTKVMWKNILTSLPKS